MIVIFLLASIMLIAGLPGLIVRSTAVEKASPERLFARGNDYYEKNEYNKAIEEYEGIIKQGYSSGPVYYNLADAYFKSGDLGHAILSYTRALYAMPRDADLLSNYKFVKSTIASKVMPSRAIWNWRPLRLYLCGLTVDEITWISVGIYVVVLLMFLVKVIARSRNPYMLWIIIFLVVCLSGNSVIVWHKSNDIRTGAITVVKSTEALYGPFDTATKFFVLHEGMKVNVVQEKDDWRKVERADGKVGWVKKSDVEMVI